MGTKQPKVWTIVEDFQAKVRKRLNESGMSVVELSRRAKINRPYLYRVLNGDAVPSLRIADQIATALGLEISVDEKKI